VIDKPAWANRLKDVDDKRKHVWLAAVTELGHGLNRVMAGRQMLEPRHLPPRGERPSSRRGAERIVRRQLHPQLWGEDVKSPLLEVNGLATIESEAVRRHERRKTRCARALRLCANREVRRSSTLEHVLLIPQTSTVVPCVMVHGTGWNSRPTKMLPVRPNLTHGSLFPNAGFSAAGSA
jgi:hypothetical protein